MGEIPPITDIKLPLQKIAEALTIVYPACKQGLEMECGDGNRLRVIRQRNQNVWGIDSKDRSSDWKKNKVEMYCRHIKPLDMHYKEDSFDCIMWDEKRLNISKKDLKIIFGHIKRICSFRAYICLPASKERDLGWWARLFLDCDLAVECISKSRSNEMVAELLC